MRDPAERIRVGDHVTIYPRGKKKIWCADFWRDGRHCRQSLRTANKKVALQKAMRLELDLAGGTFHKPPPAVSIQQAVEDYLTFLRTEQRATRTLVKYRGILDNFVTFLAGQQMTRLSQVSVSLFDRFRASRKATCHPRTMYTEGVVIKQFFKWAKSRKLIPDNPLADCKLSKPPLEPREGPSLEQVKRILAALAEPKHTQVAVLAFTGMRAGELERLMPEDIDLAGNWIHIKSRQGAETKTRRSRKVPIHACLRALLEALPRRPRPWLFTMPPSRRYPDGNHHLNVKRLNEAFEAVVRQLDMAAGRDKGGFTLHSLRHFFETFTVNAGIPQRVIDTWLGHRSDRSMASIYYRLSDEESQKFMTRVPFEGGAPAANAGKEE
jgi:integrase